MHPRMVIWMATRTQKGVKSLGPSVEDWVHTKQQNPKPQQGSLSRSNNDLDAIKDFMQRSRLLHEISVNTNSYMVKVDGEYVLRIKTEDEVARLFLEKQLTDSVYYYKLRDELHYTVVFEKDSPDLSNIIADVEIYAFDQYDDFYFEATYAIKDMFNEETLPSDYKVFRKGEIY